MLAGPGLFLGVPLGGALGVLNLRSMVFVGRRILLTRTKGPRCSPQSWRSILCTVVWLCLTQLPLNPLGFLVGFTLLPASLVLTAVRALERLPVTTPTTPTTHGERRL